MAQVIYMLVTLDHRAYDSKPQGRDFGALTNRLKAAGGTEVSAEAFCEHVKQGKTWVGGVFEPSESGWGEFTSQQLFGIDFDNEAEDGPGVKRALNPGETGYLDPLDALRRCVSHGLHPICLYFTFSASLEPLHYKYRLVFDMGEAISDRGEAEGILRTLLDMFPEADQKCSNTNRLYCGSNGEVIELWRGW